MPSSRIVLGAFVIMGCGAETATPPGDEEGSGTGVSTGVATSSTTVDPSSSGASTTDASSESTEGSTSTAEGSTSTTEGSTSTAEGSTSTTDGSSSSDESSSGSPDVCGDGIVSGEELCDDGNDVVGDGCNADCSPSGTPVWTVVEARGTRNHEAMAIDEMDRIVLVGSDVGEPWRLPLVERYASDGAFEWSVMSGTAPGDTYTGALVDVCAGPLDRAFGAGHFSSSTVQPRSVAFANALDDDNEAWTVPAADVQYAYWSGCVTTDEGPVFLGSEQPLPGDLWQMRVSAFDTAGALRWTQTVTTEFGQGGRTIAVDPVGDLVILGAAFGQSLTKLDADGNELWNREYEGFIGRNVAVDAEGSIYVIGVDATTSLPWLGAFTPDGDPSWSLGPLDDFDVLPDYSFELGAFGLAIGADGQIVVAGHNIFEEEPARLFGWWTTFSSDGELLLYSEIDTGHPDWATWIVDIGFTSEGNLAVAGFLLDPFATIDYLFLQVQSP